ncbi:beta-galactosidase [Bacillus sp. FJAT-27264]|uniref:beta-galactosidase trimerization domain-containing protein n=1 Tax=Paenibacillus sp. (strain DSM 101736 / FJAT-27264) TaxID=1850362 RepID=UPI000807B751|nr:beta-galactosidase trimerization domain-containing protein [Bacillus sp. FJAT-27264]OBZ14925.1 beta-galactosidase [Bacillus sp. FJAT-27264]
MKFRQVHLDFHTSEAIEGIGRDFSKQQFQEMLKTGHVDSITIFSKCHHGWAYHPTTANETHPHLDFDLLGAQIEAAHEIGVKTPVYLSAGLDERLARKHPQWLIRNQQEVISWTGDFMTPGYHQFCMNTPYLDVLAQQVEEVVKNYDADGIFLDIVGIRECYCQYCVADIREQGSDPRNLQDMRKLWEETYARYAKRMNDTVHAVKPELPVFHNSSHVDRGRRDLAHVNTHLELESLPTGGWGYDHFPLSARYAQTLGMDFLGMTGKFHTSWGEFGGYKHPNALRYEAALSLANGARCSIGDQLHPGGKMDLATYSLIGEAYREVAAKEEWCQDTTGIADIALLSLEAASWAAGNGPIPQHNKHDTGAVRILLEGNYLFDVVDLEADLASYKVLILPDEILITAQLKSKLDDFIAGGGKILATGRSGLSEDGSGFALDLGAAWQGVSAFRPSYLRPSFEFPSLRTASFVIYTEGQDAVLSPGGTLLGSKENSYFNRDLFTFCSHQHTPSDLQEAGVGIAEGRDGIYVAWHVFEDYAVKGSLPVKEIICYTLDLLLGNHKSLITNLPAQGVTTLQAQPTSKRWVNHLLYASPVRRGEGVEIIEDLLPLMNTEVTLAATEEVKDVYLAPQNESLPFNQVDGKLSYTVPLWACHQMVVIQF